MPKPKKSTPALPVWPDPAQEPHGADGKLSVLIEANLLFDRRSPQPIGYDGAQHLCALLAAPWAAKVRKSKHEGKGAGTPNQELLDRVLEWIEEPYPESRRLLLEVFTSWPFMGWGGFSDQFSATHTRHWLAGAFAALVIARRRADQEMVAAIVAWLVKLFACWRAHLVTAKDAKGRLRTFPAMPGSRSGDFICQSQVIDLVEALLKGKPPKPKEGVDELPSRLAREIWPTLMEAWKEGRDCDLTNVYDTVVRLDRSWPGCLDTVRTIYRQGGSFESRCDHPDHQRGAPSPPITWVKYDAGRQTVEWGTE